MRKSKSEIKRLAKEAVFERKASQNVKELTEFGVFIEDNIDCRSVLEIGTQRGGNFWFLLKLLNKNDKIGICIDLPNGFDKKGINRDSEIIRNVTDGNDNVLNSEDLTLYDIRGNSQKRQTIKRVDEVLSGDFVDILFIDADHSYTSVKKDFQNYFNFVREGGIVAFHDIRNRKVNENASDVQMFENFGVEKFWNEIKDSFKTYEFVNDNLIHGYLVQGIGALIK